MRTLTLEDGTKVEISEDSYNNLVKAVQPKTYDKLAEKLFLNKTTYYPNSGGNVDEYVCTRQAACTNRNNSTSAAQLQKLLALNKLMTVAKYLNQGWYYIPGSNKGYLIGLSDEGELNVYNHVSVKYATVYFKSQNLAEQAIEILGDWEIKLALTSNY